MPIAPNELLPDEILALTLWGEGRGEPVEGQIAIANVINNRFSAMPTKYKNIGQVCLEPRQFSCWNSNDLNYPKLLEQAKRFIDNKISDRYLMQCLYIARGIINRSFLDNTNGAMNYVTKNLFNSPNRPIWAKNAIDIKEVGNHVFFNPETSKRV